MVAQAERAPLILFMDDLQWVDSASLEALQYALPRWQASAARIMLLVGLRPEALHPHGPSPNLEPERLAGVRGTRAGAGSSWNLEPFSEPETVHLVRGLLTPPAPDFAQWVFNETRGHPFYLMETLKDLLERGALHPRRRPAGQWTFTVDAEHDLGQAVRVPSTVRAVIRSRLSRLSPSALTLLTAGTVLETRAHVRAPMRGGQRDRRAGLPALDELLSGRLLQEIPPARSASAYVFANDMLRDVVYTEAGDARRRLFHQRALATLAAAHDPVTTLGIMRWRPA